MSWIKNNIGTLASLLFVLVIFAFLIIGSFRPTQDKVIRFEVTGIATDVNASSLVQIHFECIKFCSRNEQYPETCWKQCELLGKEQA